MKYKRILVDITPTFLYNPGSGIQRVVLKIVKNLTSDYIQRNYNVEVIPFYGQNNRTVSLKHLFTNNDLSTFKKDIVLQKGDCILILDLVQGVWKHYFNFYSMAKLLGINISCVCYDLIPIRFPHFFFNPTGNFPGKQFVNDFVEYKNKLFFDIADEIICISKFTANDVINYFNELNKCHKKISYWPLGCDNLDLKEENFNGIDDIEIENLKNKPYLMMVGTLEPRKNHILAIDVMNRLWEKYNLDLCLVISGRTGWLDENEIYKKIYRNKEYNKKLFYFGYLSDKEISKLYKNAKASLNLSRVEGYDLPIIESSLHGVEVICSDIPVHREVCGKHANYVSLNKDKLIEEIKSWYDSKNKIDPKNININSWRESANKLMKVIMEDKFYKKI